MRAVTEKTLAPRQILAATAAYPAGPSGVAVCFLARSVALRRPGKTPARASVEEEETTEDVVVVVVVGGRRFVCVQPARRQATACRCSFLSRRL